MQTSNQRLFGKELSNIPNISTISTKASTNPDEIVNVKSLNQISNTNIFNEWMIQNIPNSIWNLEEGLADKDDPQQISTYAPQIFATIISNESNYPDHGYLEFQKDLNEEMRAILIDWLVDVHNKFKLRPETLFLTINIIDRYLGKVIILRSQLQLVGITALFIASKYEEIHPPEINDCVYITDNTYSKDEVIRMECSIVRKLDFCLSFASPYLILQRLIRLSGMEKQEFFVCQYLLELSFLDYAQLVYKPSILASAAVYFVRKLRGYDVAWPDSLELSTHISSSELIKPASKMGRIMVATRNSNFKAIETKFKSLRFMAASEIELHEKI